MEVVRKIDFEIQKCPKITEMGQKLTQPNAKNTTEVKSDIENQKDKNTHHTQVTLNSHYYISLEIFFAMATLAIGPLLSLTDIPTAITGLIWTISVLAIVVVYAAPVIAYLVMYMSK